MDREDVVSGVATLLSEVPRDQVDAVVAEAKLRLGMSSLPVPAPHAEKKKLLAFVGTVTVPDLNETWNTLDRFKKNKDSSVGPLIYDVGRNFTSWFGKMVVGAHTGSTLSYHTLTKNMYDRDIIAELGGEANVEVSLAEVWFLMEQQGKGKSGALLNDGKANIFYVRGSDKVLRALRVFWDGFGWHVSAIEVDYGLWFEDGRVFVRNSMQP